MAKHTTTAPNPPSARSSANDGQESDQARCSRIKGRVLEGNVQILGAVDDETADNFAKAIAHGSKTRLYEPI